VNEWAASQPGGYLYAAAFSNPPVTADLYTGPVSDWGTARDPLIGKPVGGVIDFGAGLGRYNGKHLVGGLGASGNSSCADHNIAWRMRVKLGLDKVPNGPSAAHNDEIIYDVGPSGKSQSGWGHPTCGHDAPVVAEDIHAGVVNLLLAAAKELVPPKPAKPR